ncbi:c-type cytochrome [Methylomonas methanica]|uniref:Cytochrome c domain-containing protein n=1 Tax=Methylomonas methanica (strain DSM 25384 / MC09) TaxID=857087 RepID=F9ZYC5_METMM|nr:hypothetical protein [Methylomonas methanica]AEG01030.1 hypothetical protein Metme_2644 [Methylomonas methanica MC09]
MKLKHCLPLLGLIWSLPVFAEFNPQLATLNCLSCHQDRAVSERSIPVLTGLSTQRIQQDLLDFKYDRKTATLMPRIAKGFSDDELRLIADCIAQQY